MTELRTEHFENFGYYATDEQILKDLDIKKVKETKAPKINTNIPKIKIEVSTYNGQQIREVEVLTTNFSSGTMRIRYYDLDKDENLKTIIVNKKLDSFLEQYKIIKKD